MKIKDTLDITEKKVFDMSARAGLLVIIIAILTLEATGIIQYFYSQKVIKNEASQRAQSELRVAANRITDIVNQAESAVVNNVSVAEWCLMFPDTLKMVPSRLVELNPVVVGSTVALVPDYNKKYPLFAPYAIRDSKTGDIKTISLATESYDYPSQEWFTRPLATGEGYWSEPYFDKGGSDMLVSTFSMPVRDPEGRVAAIITADISLDWLTELMESSKPYPNSFCSVTSRVGRLMVCTDSVRCGNTDTGDGNNIHYTVPVERTGWMLLVVIPEDDLLAGVHRVGMMVKILQVLGVVMIIVILRMIAKNQTKFKKLSTQKEVIQNELRIGHNIQMAMVPKTFPAFPKRTDIDIAATIVPAKEVGGDLYDFYIRDEKLFFSIGDVSGKGVPASLVMTVTQSLFRAISNRESSPAKIVSSMNDSMSEKNDSSMFVTFFCGVLDLATGQLRYCNAGHNPPVEISSGNGVSTLSVEPNVVLGIVPGFAFKEQQARLDYDDTLILYTDGVTEAENASFDQFGEKRMLAALGTKRDAAGYVDAIRSAISNFVVDAPQSDDITIFALRFLAHADAVKQERHLILHNDIQQIPQLADFMETIADEKHLGQNDTMSLNLALEEVVTNIILYAYPKGSDGLVDIEAVLREHSIEFIITDSGVPFDPTSAPDVDITLSVEERSIGGLGIYLVRQLMDEVSYKRIDDKNVLTMFKNI